MKKLFCVVVLMMIIGVFNSVVCLNCIAYGNYVSDEDYARMAQELVEQSIEDPESEQ